MISVESSGSFDNTERFLKKMSKGDMLSVLSKYGDDGVRALESATPVASGLTANLWSYEVYNRKGVYTIVWTNQNVHDGVPVAILLQYGHGTGTGGYVHGRDFINPAIRPVFDQIADDVWKVVTTS